MLTSPLPKIVVADANVVLSALIGGRAQTIFVHPRAPRCIATDTVAGEVRKYVPRLAKKRHLDEVELHAAFQILPLRWCQPSIYQHCQWRAEQLIGDRDMEDWPTTALALAVNAPVWTQDKDFEDTGLAIYTTGMLLDLLAETT